MANEPQDAGDRRSGQRPRTRDELWEQAPALRKLTRRQKRGAVVIRDLLVFQGKLLLDGLIDLVMIWVSVGATALDMVAPREGRERRFYATMRAAERFDRWLNLYGASETIGEGGEGPFGRSGADTLLGRLEEKVLGREDLENPEAGPPGPPAPRDRRRF
jgi:hypothetical protein